MTSQDPVAVDVQITSSSSVKSENLSGSVTVQVKLLGSCGSADELRELIAALDPLSLLQDKQPGLAPMVFAHSGCCP